MEPQVLRIGRLRLAGRQVTFEPVERQRVKLNAGEPVRLILEYDYVEPSPDKDATRVQLVAHRGRETLGEATGLLEDHRILDDSERSHLALDARPRERGRVPGTFRIAIRYERAAWHGETLEAHDFLHEGQLDIEIV